LDGAIVVEEVKRHQGNFGFNAESMKYEDLVLSGILDPTKVVRAALENAASAAGMLLTTEAVVASEEEKEKSKTSFPEEEY